MEASHTPLASRPVDTNFHCAKPRFPLISRYIDKFVGLQVEMLCLGSRVIRTMSLGGFASACNDT